MAAPTTSRLPAIMTYLGALSVTDITNNYEYGAEPERELKLSELPALVWFLGSGDMTAATWDMDRFVHRIVARLLYKPTEESIKSDYLTIIESFIPNIYSALRGDRTLGGNAVRFSEVHHDEPGPRNYEGKDYTGVDVTLVVVEMIDAVS